MGGVLMKKFMKKNRFFVIAALGLIVLAIVDFSLSIKALEHSYSSLKSMLLVIPPIFVLIGLFDVWVERETMIKLMGENSGAKGMLIAFFVAAFSAGPTIAAFPIAAMMLKKGAKYTNVLFFVMVWSTLKLPIVIFQVSTIGLKLTLIINITMLTVFVLGAIVANKVFTETETKALEEKAQAI
jgi:uncharacterized membrane protein YraQ (UPF0718 family)